MKEDLKTWVKSRTHLNSSAYLMLAMVNRLRYRLGNLNTLSGATHAQWNVDDSLRYIDTVFSDYQRISGCVHFRGRVAELGAGDSSGVGLLFLAHGAETVDLPDRFYSNRSPKTQQRIYQALGEKYPDIAAMLKAHDVDSLPDLTRYYGPEASGESFFIGSRQYDTIVSRSVLEHVDNPSLVLRAMYEALAPGGQLVHKVDLRDHGMYSPPASSVKFLEINAWLYHQMTTGVGYPNRFLFQEYKACLLALDPETEFYISGLHGVETDLSTGYLNEDLPPDAVSTAARFIEAHRGQFAKPFRGVPTTDLMVSSFFFVSKKPTT
jgi:SAM-dependent methyltransferase